MVRGAIVATAVLITYAAVFAAGAEVENLAYVDGEVTFDVSGSGAVSLVAQADFKYTSAKTGEEALARATSEVYRATLSATSLPVNIKFAPPAGTIEEVEVVVFVNGKETARQVFSF